MSGCPYAAASQDGGAKSKRVPYEKRTLAQLVEKAKSKKIKGCSAMKKKDLIAALRKKNGSK